MARNDPAKAPEFKRVLGNLLKTPHKTQAEMKIGKRKTKGCGDELADMIERAPEGRQLDRRQVRYAGEKESPAEAGLKCRLR